MDLKQRLNNLNIVIVSHIFSSGPALDLEEYLQEKVKSLLFIGHPFSFKSDIGSFYRQYKRSKKVKNLTTAYLHIPEPLLNIKDALLTFWWVLRLPYHVNIYIGSDNFLAFLGLLLKKLGKIEEVILYTIDYMPQRFRNHLLNRLYHFFDRECLKHCRIVWNVSPIIAEAREKYDGLKQSEYASQILVPLGMWYDRIPKKTFLKRKRYQLVFLGHLLEKQGLDVVLHAMPIILRRIPQAKLVIIGSGDYERHLKSLVKILRLENSVIFTGYVKDHKRVEKILAESMLAVAMYKPDTNSFTNWSDPGKIKNYLGAGLPVVLTNVPVVAKDIVKNKCGIIAGYTKEDFSQKVIKLLNNEKILREYSGNAVSWSKQFDWNKIFLQALEKSI